MGARSARHSSSEAEWQPRWAVDVVEATALCSGVEAAVVWNTSDQIRLVTVWWKTLGVSISVTNFSSCVEHFRPNSISYRLVVIKREEHAVLCQIHCLN
jgi:hypothetical protein